MVRPSLPARGKPTQLGVPGPPPYEDAVSSRPGRRFEEEVTSPSIATPALLEAIQSELDSDINPLAPVSLSQPPLVVPTRERNGMDATTRPAQPVPLEFAATEDALPAAHYAPAGTPADERDAWLDLIPQDSNTGVDDDGAPPEGLLPMDAWPSVAQPDHVRVAPSLVEPQLQLRDRDFGTGRPQRLRDGGLKWILPMGIFVTAGLLVMLKWAQSDDGAGLQKDAPPQSSSRPAPPVIPETPAAENETEATGRGSARASGAPATGEDSAARPASARPTKSPIHRNDTESLRSTRSERKVASRRPRSVRKRTRTAQRRPRAKPVTNQQASAGDPQTTRSIVEAREAVRALGGTTTATGDSVLTIRPLAGTDMTTPDAEKTPTTGATSTTTTPPARPEPPATTSRSTP